MAIRGEVGSEEDSFLSSPSCPLGGETAPLFTDKTDRQTDRHINCQDKDGPAIQSKLGSCMKESQMIYTHTHGTLAVFSDHSSHNSLCTDFLLPHSSLLLIVTCPVSSLCCVLLS